MILPWLVAQHSGRTSTFGRRTVPVLDSTSSCRVTIYVGKPSAIHQLTRPTQPFIPVESIKWILSCNWMSATTVRGDAIWWTLNTFAATDVLTRHLLVLLRRYWCVYTSFSTGLPTVIQRTQKPLLSAVDILYMCCPLVNDGKNISCGFLHVRWPQLATAAGMLGP